MILQVRNRPFTIGLAQNMTHLELTYPDLYIWAFGQIQVFEIFEYFVFDELSDSSSRFYGF